MQKIKVEYEIWGYDFYNKDIESWQHLFDFLRKLDNKGIQYKTEYKPENEKICYTPNYLVLEGYPKTLYKFLKREQYVENMEDFKASVIK